MAGIEVDWQPFVDGLNAAHERLKRFAAMHAPIVVSSEISNAKFQTWSTVQLTRDYYPFRTGDQFAIYSRELRGQWHYECRRLDGTAWIPEDALTNELTPMPDGQVRFREWT